VANSLRENFGTLPDVFQFGFHTYHIVMIHATRGAPGVGFAPSMGGSIAQAEALGHVRG
jgi:hypothetical protein